MSPKRRPRTIVPALERSLRAAEWIEPTDEGAAKAAIRLADDLDRIDSLLRDIDNGSLYSDPKTMQELIGKRAYMGSTLLAYLKQLGLTPETRRGNDDEQTSPLELLRSLVAHTPGDGDRDGSNAPGDVPGDGDGRAPHAQGDPGTPDPDSKG